MISYESSKWYIKLWRHRWYLYAIYLYLKCLLRPELWLDFLLDKFKIFFFEDDFFEDEKKILHKKWKDIIHHVELCKMHKFSTKIERED